MSDNVLRRRITIADLKPIATIEALAQPGPAERSPRPLMADPLIQPVAVSCDFGTARMLSMRRDLRDNA